MKKILLSTAIAGLLINAPALAQNTNQATPAPGAIAPAADTTNTTTNKGAATGERGEGADRNQRSETRGQNSERREERSERRERGEHRDGFRGRMRERYHSWRHRHHHHWFRHHRRDDR